MCHASRAESDRKWHILQSASTLGWLELRCDRKQQDLRLEHEKGWTVEALAIQVKVVSLGHQEEDC